MKISKTYGLSVLYTFVAFLAVDIGTFIWGIHAILFFVSISYQIVFLLLKGIYFIRLKNYQILISGLMGLGFLAFMFIVGNSPLYDALLIVPCLPAIAIDLYFFYRLKRFDE